MTDASSGHPTTGNSELLTEAIGPALKQCLCSVLDEPLPARMTQLLILLERREDLRPGDQDQGEAR